MSVYFVKGKGWRYDFTLNQQRHTEAWYKTKKEAKQEEAKKREDLAKPQQISEIPTDMAFLVLVNLRLDYLRAYKTERYYRDHQYMARRWLSRWRHLSCNQLSQ